MSEEIIKFVATISSQGVDQRVIIIPKNLHKLTKKYEKKQVVVEVRTVV